MSRILNYTIESENEEDYSTITTWLPNPPTLLTKLTITALTTQCSIVVLDTHDWIKIDGVEYPVEHQYTNLSGEALIGILNDILEDSEAKVDLLPSNRLEFKHENCTINDATY